MHLYHSAFQIAERKKLVSSIKNTLIDPEGGEQPYKESKVAISSDEAFAESEGNYINRDYKLPFL